MIAFPTLLVEPARAAGIPAPNSSEFDSNMKFDRERYPLFHVFCVMQLGRPLPYPSAHWDNARVIARFAGQERTVHKHQIFEAGFV